MLCGLSPGSRCVNPSTYIGGRQAVMVTGPHPNGRYAATFLFAPEGARWELFATSLECAKQRAEVVCARHPRGRTFCGAAQSDVCAGRPG